MGTDLLATAKIKLVREMERAHTARVRFAATDANLLNLGQVVELYRNRFREDGGLQPTTNDLGAQNPLL